MSLQLDPEESETRALFEFAGDFEGQRVLEVGCGDGRLTWRYASQAARVVAIDPDPVRVAQAKASLAENQQEHIDFRAQDLEEFERGWVFPDRFDLAILSWSL